MSRKRLTKDLMNKFSILSGAKFFSLGILCRSSFFFTRHDFQRLLFNEKQYSYP